MAHYFLRQKQGHNMVHNHTHLIIYAHPNPESFNQAVLQKVVEASEGHKVIIRDLNAENFPPVLKWQECINTFSKQYEEDVQAEQALWKEADLITFVYPLWWMGFPAILKGYIDRILTHGFAYQTGKGASIGLLKGKKIQQFVTMGNTNEKYEQKGFLQSLDHTLGNGLFNFCGIENVQMHFLGGTGMPTIDYQAVLENIKHITEANLKS